MIVSFSATTFPLAFNNKNTAKTLTIDFVSAIINLLNISRSFLINFNRPNILAAVLLLLFNISSSVDFNFSIISL
jgi:hypothetical protein